MKRLLALSLVCVAGCTQDFDAFAPTGDGLGGDASATRDGAMPPGPPSDAADDRGHPDASTAPDGAPINDAALEGAGPDGGACDGSAGCLGDAKTCATMCTTVFQSCQTACGNNNGCKMQCASKEATCKGNCLQTCTTCLAPGCGTVAECTTASQ